MIQARRTHLKRLSAAVIGVVLAVVLGVPVLFGTELPTTEPWQKTLRDYMANLTTDDFNVNLGGLLVPPDNFAFASEEETLRHWLLFLDERGNLPDKNFAGLNLDSKYFTLAEIESGEGVHMSVGRDNAFFEALSTAWWVQWNSAVKNPLQGDRGLKLRCFAVCAVDLVMQHDYSRNHPVLSTWMGGKISWIACSYRAAKDILPEEVKEAYKTGMKVLFDKICETAPRGSGGGNMEFPQLSGMWYAAQELKADYPDYPAKALERAKRVIDFEMRNSFWHEHSDVGSGAPDSLYEGVAQYWLSWYAAVSGDSVAREAVVNSTKLKAFLMLPEPDGMNYFAPSHFNSACSEGYEHAVRTYAQGFILASLSDHAKYLVWCGLQGQVPPVSVLPSKEEMETTLGRRSIKGGIQRVNSDLKDTKISSRKPPLWGDRGYGTDGFPLAFENYPDGLCAQLRALDQSNSPLKKPPFGRDTDFCEVFNDGPRNFFLAAKLGDYGVVIHTGPTAHDYGGGVTGKSGGSLSAFWSKATGTVILGKSRHTQGNPGQYDTWTGTNGWDSWAVHAISGVNADGLPFSSARNRFFVPGSTDPVYKVSEKEIAVSVTGKIGQHDGGLSAPDNAITHEVNYSRDFHLDSGGLRITSTLTSDTKDRVSQLYEMIPVFLKDQGTQRDLAETTIQYQANGRWENVTTDLVTATKIRLRKFDADVFIIFDEPQSFKLSPGVWKCGVGQCDSRIRNLMIDLLRGSGQVANMPERSSVSYRIMTRLPAD